MGTPNEVSTAPRSRSFPKKLTLIILSVGATGILVETSILKKVTVLPCRKNDAESRYAGQNQNNATGQNFRLDIIFGHLHYAKTAGTDVNGQLATRYERVCGHKGYSYDAFQFNKRLKKKAMSRQGPLGIEDGGPDVFSHFKKSFNRGKVPWAVMQEIGFENCDYVSLERPWQDWIPIAKLWPVELHVPCRDPLEHLMSQCNYMHHEFNCQATDLVKEVRGCFVEPNRFSAKLARVKNVTLKCFKAAPVEPYLEYIDQFLQRKRLPATYIHRASNDQRNRENECLWKNQTLAKVVLDILLRHDYYRWCNQCIGSNNDLLRHL